MEYQVNGIKYKINSFWSKEQHNESIIQKQRSLRKDLIFEDNKMTVYNKTNPKIELSKGCRACKAGTWWSLFPGTKCNIDCKFCPQIKPLEEQEVYESPKVYSGGVLIEDIKLYIEKAGNKLTGVSYSGGEPFLYLDKIYEVASHIQKTQKHIYQWIYTNGMLITEDKLKKLKNVGIEEIRVNLAATDFDNNIINKLEMIKEIMGNVLVEVPATPDTFHKLVIEKNINTIVDLGVEQINLIELTLQRGINWKTYTDNKDIYIYEHNGGKTFSPAHSRHITLGVMEYVIDNKLNVLVNDCSNDAKKAQQVAKSQNAPSFLK